MCSNCDVLCLNVIFILLMWFFNQIENVSNKCFFLMILWIMSYLVYGLYYFRTFCYIYRCRWKLRGVSNQSLEIRTLSRNVDLCPHLIMGITNFRLVLIMTCNCVRNFIFRIECTVSLVFLSLRLTYFET